MIKTKHIKSIIIILSLILLQNCQVKRTTKTHGINYLENRYKILEVNKPAFLIPSKSLGLWIGIWLISIVFVQYTIILIA